MTAPSYVHGYSSREAERLCDQADTLATLLHHDTRFPAGSVLLEAGCGVGAQTVTLARNNPDVRIVAVDRSLDSLAKARQRVADEGLDNVEFIHGDLMSLDFQAGAFDSVFLCFVLEHVPNPDTFLKALIAYTKPGGLICAIEGDHGSTFFYPECQQSHRAIQCLVELQARGGGDACIGRRLLPLFDQVGLTQVEVSPRFVYADRTRPALVSGFTLNTFTAMVEGVRDATVTEGLMTAEEFQQGLDGLRRCSQPDGVFCYTFFKAIGRKSLPTRA